MTSILFIVFLPLLAAIVAGLGNKAIGFVPAKLITTGALFSSQINREIAAADHSASALHGALSGR